jgi:hypothetical protein
MPELKDLKKLDFIPTVTNLKEIPYKDKIREKMRKFSQNAKRYYKLFY